MLRADQMFILCLCMFSNSTPSFTPQLGAGNEFHKFQNRVKILDQATRPRINPPKVPKELEFLSELKWAFADPRSRVVKIKMQRAFADLVGEFKM